MKATFSCEIIHSQEFVWQSGMRPRVSIMPGLPTHLLHELNVSTVPTATLVMRLIE